MRSGPAARVITIAISRDPALVRTVRLVAAAVARRAGQGEEFVEEVRLAVGETCALLVGDAAGLTTAYDPPVSGAEDRVTVSMSFGERLQVRVASPGKLPADDQPDTAVDGVEPWALLHGLLDDLTFEQDGPDTVVSMSWLLV